MRSSNMSSVNNSSHSSCVLSLCQLWFFTLKRGGKEQSNRMPRVQHECFKGAISVGGFNTKNLDNTLAEISCRGIWLGFTNKQRPRREVSGLFEATKKHRKTALRTVETVEIILVDDQPLDHGWKLKSHNSQHKPKHQTGPTAQWRVSPLAKICAPHEINCPPG